MFLIFGVYDVCLATLKIRTAHSHNIVALHLIFIISMFLGKTKTVAGQVKKKQPDYKVAYLTLVIKDIPLNLNF